MHYPPTLNTGTNIFVFGSNQAGQHGAGAALEARRHWGAIYGQSTGPQGHAYAIPTKDERLATLSIPRIDFYTRQFLAYANANPALTFLVTRIGCGLAGYTDAQIAPLFKDAPANCTLPNEWRLILNHAHA